MNSIKFFVLIFQIIFLFVDISYSQINAKIIYSTILESEDFQELESVLIINSKNNSVFYSTEKDSQDTLSNYLTNKNDTDSSLQLSLDFNFQPPDDSTKYFVYINRDANQILSKKTFFKEGKYHPCLVSDQLDIFQWVLTGESKVIESFNAYKATTTFRGREYTAWYTPEINANAGPWKFNGLPGLILEVYDKELGVQFHLSSIIIPFETEGKIVRPSNGLIISFEEFIELNNPERIVQEFLDLVSSRLPNGSKVSSRPSISVKKNMKGIERVF